MIEETAVGRPKLQPAALRPARLLTVYAAEEKSGSLLRDRLLTNRQSKLEEGTPGCICFRPQPSSVSLDDRTTDRQPHAQTLGFSRIKGVEKTVKALWIQP
jgi:hypothetical protein